MRNAHGYAVLTDPRKDRPTELDTITCGHCNKIDHIKPGQRPEDLGGLCKCCMQLICSLCVGKDCYPLMKRIEDMEARDRFRREVTG